MTKQNSSKQRYGFTIIEVVLVLAIAGLIFLMVFVALPMLQRNQRNTQRKDDLARFLTAVEDYQSNNNGRLPFRYIWGGMFVESDSVTQFVLRYIDNSCTDQTYSSWNPPDDACAGDQFRDPDGSIYSFIAREFESALSGNRDVAAAMVRINDDSDTDHHIYVFSTAVCGTTEGSIVRAGGPRYVAMLMVLEGGGIACVTNGARANIGSIDNVGTTTLYGHPH